MIILTFDGEFNFTSLLVWVGGDGCAHLFQSAAEGQVEGALFIEHFGCHGVLLHIGSTCAVNGGVDLALWLYGCSVVSECWACAEYGYA